MLPESSSLCVFLYCLKMHTIPHKHHSTVGLLAVYCWPIALSTCLLFLLRCRGVAITTMMAYERSIYGAAGARVYVCSPLLVFIRI